MKVAFHINHLDLRGTGVAVYLYAHHNEAILGNESVIVCPSRSAQPLYQDERSEEHFERRFPVHRYEDFQEVDKLLERLGVDVFYTIKSGQRDEILSKACRTGVHAVFQHYEPHGDVYAYVSEWLARTMGDGDNPWVPHIVDLPDIAEDMREALSIPRDAIVFGRHGGSDTFDIDFAHKAVRKTAQRRPHLYFVFLNTEPFCDPLPNVIHLPGTADPVEKVRFINTCDAMLHARTQGETFGCAIAEFSARNKPIITFRGGPDQAHLELLGDKGIYYESRRELMRVLRDFEPSPHEDWDVYSKPFGPDSVMERFKQVFLS
jgi:hypothetical protein